MGIGGFIRGCLAEYKIKRPRGSFEKDYEEFGD